MQVFDGKTYLKIDIANNFGLDKKSWDERIAWFDQNQDQLDSLLDQAESPALFYAGVQAWGAVQKGEPIGYPISLDATSSGLQILAALTGDRLAAQLCNVVDTGRREDAYTGVYEHMLAKLGEGAKIKRDDCKKAIMTSLYGSTAVPKRVFGDRTPLLYTFLESMTELAPAAWELNETFLKLWDPKRLVYEWVLPDNFHVRCKVMASVTETVHFLNEPFEVVRKVNAPIQEGRALGANTIHSVDGMIVREMARRCDYDPAWMELVRGLLDGSSGHFMRGEAKKEARRMVGILWKHYQESGYLSARILEYLDSETIKLVDPEPIRELVESLPKKPFKVIANHDCFRCLPHYGNDLRRQYNRQLYEIARSNLLGFLLAQHLQRPVNQVKVGKLDPTLAQDIPSTNYALS